MSKDISRTDALSGPKAVDGVFRAVRSALFGVALVSLLVNVLMLTGPLYMLQVYDRVLASGSVPTLLVISGFALVLYAVFGLLEGLRSRILSRIGQRIDARLSGLAFVVSSRLPLRLGAGAAKLRPVQDLDAVRTFMSGPGPSAIFDLPWMPVYFALLFLFHPLLGWLAIGAAVLICILIGLNEATSRKPVSEAARASSRRAAVEEAGRRNAEALGAMAMEGALMQRWERENEAFLDVQRRAQDWSGFFATAIKTVRFLLQSAVLGLGAWLSILHEVSPGVVIAGSILTSRALAPVEQAVGHWRSFAAARLGRRRLREVFAKLADAETERLELPLPQRALAVEHLACGPAGMNRPVVQGVAFELAAGDGLGIIGPSGSGKSTLARALVGLAPPLHGAVRLDGAELSQWPPARRGRIIGYLPQDVQLFDGTVTENIARFEPGADAEAVIEAARMADIHDFVIGLPEGYNTLIGSEGMMLSGGQQQRIALARALFRKPFLVVLDEPNSNLDSDGEAALTRAIREIRAAGCIVVVIAHRPSAIAAVDKVLCLRDGRMAAFGPKEEVLKRVVAPVPQSGVA